MCQALTRKFVYFRFGIRLPAHGSVVGCLKEDTGDEMLFTEIIIITLRKRVFSIPDKDKATHHEK